MVRVGSISNWTKLLFQYGFLEEYEIKSGYYKKQKIVRTVKFKREKEKSIDDFDFNEDFRNEKENNVSLKSGIKKYSDLQSKKQVKKNTSKDIEDDNLKNDNEEDLLPLFPSENYLDL